jgi:hypothetical protein
VNQEQEATGPGIAVLSPSLQVLHINRRAIMLLDQLKHTAQNVGTERGVVAAPLHQLCQDIIEILQARLRSNNWEQFQQCRTIGESTRTILLKGFGLPDRRGLSYSRVVMLLSPHIPAPMPGNGKEIPEMAGDERMACTTHDMIAPPLPIQGLPLSMA